MLGLLMAFVTVAVAALSFAMGARWGMRRATRDAATWLVRPHTADSLARVQGAEQGHPVVSEGVFVRTNLPGSTSTMD